MSITDPVTQSTVSSVPTTISASQALPGNAVQAIAGAVAQQTAALIPQSQTQGAIIKDKQLSVGMYGMSPTQLETAGVIKPGSSRLIKSLASRGKNVNQALPPSMFTGMPGAGNLGTLSTNLSAQTDALSENLRGAQSQLQNAGVMTGQEVPGQIGGAIMSTAQNGLGPTLGAIDAAAKGPISNLQGLQGQAQGKLDKVMGDIGSGNFAGKVAESAGGALSGLQSSVESIAVSPTLEDVVSQSQGAAAAAFESIKASLPTLQAGVPQNLGAIAKASAAQTATASSTSISEQFKQEVASKTSSAVGTGFGAAAGALGTSAAGLAQMATGSVTGPIQNTLGDIAQGANKLGAKLGSSGSVAESLISAASTAPAANTIASAFSSPTSLISSTSKATDLSDTAKNIVNGSAASISSTVASGLSNLPGGQSAAGSLQNLAKPLQNLPGTADIKGAIQGAATDAINKIGGQIAGKANDLLEKAGGLQNQLKSLASAGLPAGAAAALQSAMGSIASAGSGIKMPSLGFNTTDRSSITAGIKSVLDDPQIPPPDLLGEVSESSKGIIEDVKEQTETFKAENSALTAKFTELRTEANTKYGLFLQLRDTLPQGDPAIEQARKAALASSKKAAAVAKEIEALYAKYPDLSLATTSTPSTGTTVGRTLAGDSSTGIGSAT